MRVLAIARLSTRVKYLKKYLPPLDISSTALIMELADGKRDIVDPEVRAYVSSLVTAVSSIGCSLVKSPDAF
jgi:hypothetical protein